MTPESLIEIDTVVLMAHIEADEEGRSATLNACHKSWLDYSRTMTWMASRGNMIFILVGPKIPNFD